MHLIYFKCLLGWKIWEGVRCCNTENAWLLYFAEMG